MEPERVPLSGKEYGAMQALFALRSGFEEAAPRLEKRAEAAGVTEQIEQLRELSKAVMDGLLKTVPVNKLQHILRNFDLTRVYIKIEAHGIPTVDNTSYTLVPAKALDYVMNAMIDNYCLLCDKSEVDGRKCPHRAAMEACLPHAIRVSRGSEKCMFADLAIGLDEMVEQ